MSDEDVTYEYAIAPPAGPGNQVWYMLTPYMQSVGFRLVRRRVEPGEPNLMAYERDWEEITSSNVVVFPTVSADKCQWPACADTTCRFDCKAERDEG